MMAPGSERKLGSMRTASCSGSQSCERLVDQAERLEQIDIDVSREIGRDRERQRQQPQQHLPAAEFMQRDRPRRAGADRE